MYIYSGRDVVNLLDELILMWLEERMTALLMIKKGEIQVLKIEKVGMAHRTNKNS